eukprot:15453274-Alexandrium_andersonii.AAC.1
MRPDTLEGPWASRTPPADGLPGEASWAIGSVTPDLMVEGRPRWSWLARAHALANKWEVTIGGLRRELS